MIHKSETINSLYFKVLFGHIHLAYNIGQIRVGISLIFSVPVVVCFKVCYSTLHTAQRDTVHVAQYNNMIKQ